MAKVSVLFRREGKGHEEVGKFPLVHFIEFSRPHDSMEKIVRCISLTWSNNDDKHPILSERSCTSGEDSLSVGGVDSSGADLFNQGTNSCGERTFCCPSFQ